MLDTNVATDSDRQTGIFECLTCVVMMYGTTAGWDYLWPCKRCVCMQGWTLNDIINQWLTIIYINSCDT